MRNRDEAVYLARAAYQNLPQVNKADFNTTMLIELIMRQGVRDPTTRHKLDAARVRVVRADGQKTTAGMVYRNCMVVNQAAREAHCPLEAICETEK